MRFIVIGMDFAERQLDISPTFGKGIVRAVCIVVGAQRRSVIVCAIDQSNFILPKDDAAIVQTEVLHDQPDRRLVRDRFGRRQFDPSFGADAAPYRIMEFNFDTECLRNNAETGVRRLILKGEVPLFLQRS